MRGNVNTDRREDLAVKAFTFQANGRKVTVTATNLFLAVRLARLVSDVGEKIQATSLVSFVPVALFRS